MDFPERFEVMNKNRGLLLRMLLALAVCISFCGTVLLVAVPLALCDAAAGMVAWACGSSPVAAVLARDGIAAEVVHFGAMVGFLVLMRARGADIAGTGVRTARPERAWMVRCALELGALVVVSELAIRALSHLVPSWVACGAVMAALCFLPLAGALAAATPAAPEREREDPVRWSLALARRRPRHTALCAGALAVLQELLRGQLGNAVLRAMPGGSLSDIGLTALANALPMDIFLMYTATFWLAYSTELRRATAGALPRS